MCFQFRVESLKDLYSFPVQKFVKQNKKQTRVRSLITPRTGSLSKKKDSSLRPFLFLFISISFVPLILVSFLLFLCLAVAVVVVDPSRLLPSSYTTIKDMSGVSLS